jgi:hypothetical protein
VSLAPLDPFVLTILEPRNGTVVNTPTVRVRGLVTQDALLTVNGDLISPGVEGNWSADVPLVEGPNAIETIASDFLGNQKSHSIAVIKIP